MSTPKTITLLVAISLLSGALYAPACFGSATYSGSLQYTPPAPADTGDGLNVLGPSGQWDSYTVTFSWTVTDTDTTYPAYPWKYEYRMQHDGTQFGYSHSIVESSTNFTADNMYGLTGASLASVTTQTVLAGNPGMPEDVYGIRFNPPTSGMFDWTWSFYSDRAPVWGDFYARCGGLQGGINSAYNYNMDAFGVERGFLSPDTDPAAGPSNGSIDFHVLVPDTTTTVVPVPGALLLAGLGTSLVTWMRRRRTL